MERSTLSTNLKISFSSNTFNICASSIVPNNTEIEVLILFSIAQDRPSIEKEGKS